MGCAAVVVGMGGVIRIGLGRRMGVLAWGETISQSGRFPVLKEVRERSEAEQEDSDSNKEHKV